MARYRRIEHSALRRLRAAAEAHRCGRSASVVARTPGGGAALAGGPLSASPAPVAAGGVLGFSASKAPSPEQEAAPSTSGPTVAGVAVPRIGHGAMLDVVVAVLAGTLVIALVIAGSLGLLPGTRQRSRGHAGPRRPP